MWLRTNNALEKPILLFNTEKTTTMLHWFIPITWKQLWGINRLSARKLLENSKWLTQQNYTSTAGKETIQVRNSNKFKKQRKNWLSCEDLRALLEYHKSFGSAVSWRRHRQVEEDKMMVCSFCGGGEMLSQRCLRFRVRENGVSDI